MNIKTYGCRASSPLSHIGGTRYGGNTSCMTVESKGVSLVLDAGSGLTILEKELRETNPECLINPQLNVLVSHLHLDHIIGFATFKPVWARESQMRVYTCCRDESTPLKEQLFGVFKPPYWPSALMDVSGVTCVPIESGVPFSIAHFTVTPFVACHPDKTLSFHITDGEKSLVHLLDNEIDRMAKDEYALMLEMCKGVDMVVFDSAYAQEDYPKLRGWGHSTVAQGVAFARQCKPRYMLFSHFAQQYSDDEIDSWARFYENETCSTFILGSDGMGMTL